MAIIVKCFRSGNTLRVSLLSALRYALKAQAGDHLSFDDTHPHGVFVTNLSEAQRNKKPRKKK